MKRTRYVITKSPFLGGWAVVSPPDILGRCEGETLPTFQLALIWMDAHAEIAFETFYEIHTATEPAPRSP